jgi:cytoskeletal protein CcmA (bactofilin family)
MWKRDEAVRSPAVPNHETSAAAPAAQATRPDNMVRGQNERDVVNIGKSVVIKGELNGSEDLTIEGHVEGRIELRDHVLTIGPNGKIKAELFAKAIVVLGEVIGNVTASEKVDIRENGSVEGDITAPRVAIAEGAHFRGSVDMQNKGAKPAAAQAPRPAPPVVEARSQGQTAPSPQPAPQAAAAGQGQRVGV